MDSCGVVGDVLELREVSGAGHGYVAKRDVRKGEEVAVAHRSTFITEFSLCEDTGDLSDAVHSLDSLSTAMLCKELRMALYLLVERAKGDSSKLAWYIKLLPKQPVWLGGAPQKVVRELQHPARVEKIERWQQRIQQLYQKLQALLKRDTRLRAAVGEVVTPAAFVWAHCILETRAFSITMRGGCPHPSHTSDEHNWALLPTVDMFNHSSSGLQNYSYHPSREAMVFVADREIAAGEEVCIVYNRWMGAYQFAKHYGFTPSETREHDTFPIKVPLPPPTTPLAMAKARVLETSQLDADCYVQGDGTPSANLLCMLRLLALTHHDFAEGVERVVERRRAYCAENELAAATLFVRILRSQLEQFTTTIAQDRRLLAHPPPNASPAALLCVAVRIADKVTLTTAYSSAVKRQQVLGDAVYTGCNEAVLLSRASHRAKGRLGMCGLQDVLAAAEAERRSQITEDT
eukprot:Sspe_Gene.54904::Locus_30250_Transcript_1_1_Confidence_1.000_Length_1445::g.54904::m.54904